jgi:hypothetical protein
MSTMNVISTVFKDYNFNLFDNSSVVYLCLSAVGLPEDDLRRMKCIGLMVDFM